MYNMLGSECETNAKKVGWSLREHSEGFEYSLPPLPSYVVILEDIK